MIHSRPLTSEELNSIQHIIFDFGGILFDIDYDAPVRAFAQLGGNGFDAIYAQSAQSDLFDKLEIGAISNAEFYQEIRTVLSVNHSDAVLEEAWNSILTGIPKGRIDLIHQLKSTYNTFLFSNTNAIHVSAFEKMVDDEMGIDYFRSAFKKVHYSNVLGFKKPYPESFIKYCELEGINPSHTLFIDDSIQHVKGADEAGLMALHMNVDEMDIRDVFSNFTQ